MQAENKNGLRSHLLRSLKNLPVGVLLVVSIFSVSSGSDVMMILNGGAKSR